MFMNANLVMYTVYKLRKTVRRNKKTKSNKVHLGRMISRIKELRESEQDYLASEPAASPADLIQK